MFKTNCLITLYRCTGMADGETCYSEGEMFRAFFIENSQMEENGIVQDHSEILLEPAAHPVPGDLLEQNGLRRTLAGVRSCTAVDGRITAYRCSFMK